MSGINASVHDQSLRLYERQQRGTDGVSVPVFVFTNWWWGRLDEQKAYSRTIDQKVQHTFDAIAEFGDDAYIPIQGVLKDEDGNLWWIRGAQSQRATRLQTVSLDRISEEVVTTVTLIERADALNSGTQLVEPS